MKLELPTDEGTNRVFSRVYTVLTRDLHYPGAEAHALIVDYYTKFTDAYYCKSIGVPVHDDCFFHHQGEEDIAMRIHYYLKLNLNPSPVEYMEWRHKVVKREITIQHKRSD